MMPVVMKKLVLKGDWRHYWMIYLNPRKFQEGYESLDYAVKAV